MIVDYHTHTAFCKHAHGSLEDYVQRAVELGLDEIGTSDHIPLPGNYDEQHRMDLEEYYSGYAPSVTTIIEKFKSRIRVKRGIECDHLDWASEWTAQFIKENDFDYVIGSIHFVGPVGKEKPLFGREYDQSEIESLYEGYFTELASSARSGLYDIVAHFDIVKKFGPFASKKVDELVWEALREIKKADLCIEINTSGLRKPEREPYPGKNVLTFARDLRIPLTLGSDAHRPEQVGMNFDVAVELVERYGNGRIALFDRRVRSEASVTTMQLR